MKPQLIVAALCVATAAATAAEYTATSCRLRVVEGSWVDMSGLTHHLNISHARQPGAKAKLDVSKCVNDGWGWYVNNYWDELYMPNDLQLGWQASEIYDAELAYVIRVTFNNGTKGYQPTSSGNIMFSVSVQPNGDQYYWHENNIGSPPAGVAWADYVMHAYGQWVVGVQLVNYGYGLLTPPNISGPSVPLGYVN